MEQFAKRLFLGCAFFVFISRASSKIDSEEPPAELLEKNYENENYDDLNDLQNATQPGQASTYRTKINSDFDSGHGTLETEKFNWAITKKDSVLLSREVDRQKAKLREIDEEASRIEQRIAELENQKYISSSDYKLNFTKLGEKLNLGTTDANSETEMITKPTHIVPIPNEKPKEIRKHSDASEVHGESERQSKTITNSLDRDTDINDPMQVITGNNYKIKSKSSADKQDIVGRETKSYEDDDDVEELKNVIRKDSAGENNDDIAVEKREAKPTKPKHYFGHVEPFRAAQKLARAMGVKSGPGVTFVVTPIPFNVKKCATKSSAKIVFKLYNMEPADFAKGHVHITLKATPPVSKIAIQFVSQSGYFIGSLQEYTDFKCMDGREDSYLDGIGRKIYKVPKQDLTINKWTDVDAVTFEFGQPREQFHFFWKFHKYEMDESSEGYQLQTFNVMSDNPFCFVPKFSKVFAALTYAGDHSILKGMPNCHLSAVSVPPASTTDLLTLDPDYQKHLDKKIPPAGNGGYCLSEKLFGKFPRCAPAGEPEVLEFSAFQVFPITHGWIHLVIKVAEKNKNDAVLHQIIVQAISRSGHIVGKWLGKVKGCNDQNQTIENLPKTVAHFEAPPIGRQSINYSPTLVGLEFGPDAKEANLLWKYSIQESREVSEGVQFRVFLENPIIKNCYIDLHSPVFQPPAFQKETIISTEMETQLPHSCIHQSLALKFEGTFAMNMDSDYFNECFKAGFRQGKPADLPKVPTTPTTPNSTIKRTTEKLLALKTPKPKIEEKEKEDEEHKEYVDVVFPPKQSVAKAEAFNRRNFYEGCGETKGCFGDPSGCVKLRSCKASVSFRRKTDRCVFEIMGETGKYIAMGLSRDRLMNEDTVVECIRESDEIRIYLSMNTVNRKHFRMRNHTSLSLLKGSFSSNIIYCEFERFQHFTWRGLDFDLAAEKFYILLARGDTARNGAFGDIDYHARGSTASPESYLLMEMFGKSALRIYLEKFHSVSTIVVWFFLIPTSTFVVRYFKETWVDKYICTLSVWFGVHILIVIPSIVVALLSLGAICWVLDSFPGQTDKGWHFHSVVGIMALAGLVFQMFLGIIISRSTRRLIWAHQLHSVFGHSAFLLGLVLIYFSKDLKRGLPCSAGPIVIGYVIFYFVFHIIMSYQVCYVDFIQGEFISRVYGAPGLRPARITMLESEAPGANARKALLWIFMVVLMALTASIITLYLLGNKDCDTLRIEAAMELPEYEEY